MDFEEKISNRSWNIPSCGYSQLQGYSALSHGISGLAVFPSQTLPHKSSDHSTPSQKIAGAAVVRCLSPSTWLFSRHTRQLVNEAMGTFRSLQAAVADASSTAVSSEEVDLTPVFIKKSREYRSMLQACVCSLNTALDKEPQHTDLYQQMAEQCQLLYKMELLLGLTEIIFVDSRPGSLVLGQLVCWVRLHFPGCTEQMVQVMADDQPSDHPLYWKAVYGLACQGRLSDARQLLQQHPLSHTDPFTAMEEILRKMPTYQVYGGVSEAEFLLRWQHWQAECENRLHRGEFTAWSHLGKLAEILCGNAPAILSVTNLSCEGGPGGGSWVPHLVATLLYTQPNIKLHRLHGAALRAIADCRDKLSALDSLLLAAIEGDAMQVVRGCQQSLDNMWLSAHLTDLLYHALTAQHQSHQSLAALRDSLVQEYALELADHPSLWQVGVIYLDYCGGDVDGEPCPLTTMVLERVPLTSDAKAHKVINMATQRNLDQVVVGVCRVMGRSSSREGRLAAAIWWGVRAKDAAFTSHIAHQVLQRYLSSGEFQSSALLLDHLGPAMLLSDTLTFLGKYREFHSLYQQGEYKRAGDLLVTLIASKLAPQYFWPVLLLDALPLLQEPGGDAGEGGTGLLVSGEGDVVLSSTHTYELMYCLNTVMERLKTNDKGELSLDSSCPAADSGLVRAFQQREEELRSRLTHNLARAIVAEGTTYTDTSCLLTLGTVAG